MTKEITREQLELILYYFLKSGGIKNYKQNLVELSLQLKKATKRIENNGNKK